MKKMINSIDYTPQGVCSRLIHIEECGGVIAAAHFLGGCNGNLKGICSLVKGLKIEEAIEKLQGIRCGEKSTSCPDQLAKALQILQKSQKENSAYEL